jgi:hypothetical protein
MEEEVKRAGKLRTDGFIEHAQYHVDIDLNQANIVKL